MGKANLEQILHFSLTQNLVDALVEDKALNINIIFNSNQNIKVKVSAFEEKYLTEFSSSNVAKTLDTECACNLTDQIIEFIDECGLLHESYHKFSCKIAEYIAVSTHHDGIGLYLNKAQLRLIKRSELNKRYSLGADTTTSAFHDGFNANTHVPAIWSKSVSNFIAVEI